MVGETLRVDGGRGDDDLQVGTSAAKLMQVPKEEINVEAALVSLVDDDRVVCAQVTIVIELRQKDSIGHDLDQCVLGHPVVEAHSETDCLADTAAELFGYSLGNSPGSEPARLSMADQPADAPACLEQQLRQLRALARSSVTCEHHDLA